MTRGEQKPKPWCYVIGDNDTAISTAWCLRDAGIPVRIFCLDPRGIARCSRRARVTDLTGLGKDRTRISEEIARIARTEPLKPVLMACGDHESIMITGHRDLLSPVCSLRALTLEQLLSVVSKDRLYAAASVVGIETPPTTISPTLAQLSVWTRDHPPPYLVKPYYLGEKSSVLQTKNRLFETAGALNAFVEETGGASLIIQQLIRGGDGWVFDCYGVCDRRGRIVTMASHRRLRQHPADRGVSTFGEIPSLSVPESERAVFALTEKLLSRVYYHGIFGIEWVKDLTTSRYYLLDFNARPFLTIRHLKDCGVNLPAISYEELAGGDVSSVARTPRLKHKYWLDFPADVLSFRAHRARKQISVHTWLASLAKPTSFAVFSLRDPLPTIVRGAETVASFGRSAMRKITRRFSPK